MTDPWFWPLAFVAQLICMVGAVGAACLFWERDRRALLAQITQQDAPVGGTRHCPGSVIDFAAHVCDRYGVHVIAMPPDRATVTRICQATLEHVREEARMTLALPEEIVPAAGPAGQE